MSMPPLPNSPTTKALIQDLLAAREDVEDAALVYRNKLAIAEELGHNRSALSATISAIRKRQKAIDKNQLDLFNARNDAIADYLAEFYGAAAGTAA